MKTTLSLLTIVAEGLLKDSIIKMLRKHGASGFTITRTDGEGSRGTRAKDWEGPNLKYECVLPPDAADAVLEEISDQYFENHALVAWLSEVSVMRSEKFVGKQE